MGGRDREAEEEEKEEERNSCRILLIVVYIGNKYFKWQVVHLLMHPFPFALSNGGIQVQFLLASPFSLEISIKWQWFIFPGL